MNINPKNLLGILKACRESNVTKLKCGDLEIDFASEIAKPIVPVVSETTSEPTSLMMETAEKDRDLRANLEAIDDIVDNLHITDPDKFEQLQLEHELEPDGGTAQH